MNNNNNKVVWVVTKEYWESSQVKKVFNSLEKAEEYIEIMEIIEKMKGMEEQSDYNWYEFDVE